MTYYKLLHDLKWKRRQTLLLVLLRSSILIDFLMFCFILDKSGWYNVFLADSGVYDLKIVYSN
jgi:ABC-type spermidine/putrescine transport system permease subunit I